tara:strand:+ start:3303 stop:3497 length:195 start_codon:yes stop_codon:yes gene_type:complete
MILTIEQVKIGLQHKRLYAVSKATGLSYPVLKRLSEGNSENYTYNTLKLISKYIIECHNRLEVI